MTAWRRFLVACAAAAPLVATGSPGRRAAARPAETIAAPNPFTDARTGMSFVTVPAGSFVMGSPPDEVGRGADERAHAVAITRSFLLGKTEVTQREWRTIMGANPSHFADCGPTCPVENINDIEVQAFLRQLNARAAHVRYRLPTEAEWEYACRAGSTTPFATGENLTTDQANYNGTFPYGRFPPGIYRARTTPAGTFPPNAWGLADMHGNVWEWTADWYAPYPDGSAVDPRGPDTGAKLVIRGGSWYFDANSARCALRYTHAPIDRGFSLGFRVAADRTP